MKFDALGKALLSIEHPNVAQLEGVGVHDFLGS
jgi:hypothetical protein